MAHAANSSDAGRGSKLDAVPAGSRVRARATLDGPVFAAASSGSLQLAHPVGAKEPKK
jgi:hypothetical protein